MVESTYLNEHLGIPFWAASQIKFSSVMFSIALCMLFLSVHGSIVRNILVVLGEMSFGIYLLHIPVKMGIENVITRIIPQTSPIWQMLDIIATLAACWAILKLAHRFLPEKANRYFGLK